MLKSSASPWRRAPFAGLSWVVLRLGAARLTALLLATSLVAFCTLVTGARAADPAKLVDPSGLYATVAHSPTRSDPDKAAFIAQLLVRRDGGARAADAADAFAAVWTAEPRLVAALGVGDLGRALDRLQVTRTSAAKAAAAAHQAADDLNAGRATGALSALLAALPPPTEPAPPPTAAPRTLDASGTLSSAQTDAEAGQAITFPVGSQWVVRVAPDGNWVRVSGRLGDQERQLTLPACGPVYRLAGGVGIPVCGSAPAGGTMVGVHGFVVVTRAQFWAHIEVITGNSRHAGDAVGETSRYAADPG